MEEFYEKTAHETDYIDTGICSFSYKFCRCSCCQCNKKEAAAVQKQPDPADRAKKVPAAPQTPAPPLAGRLFAVGVSDTKLTAKDVTITSESPLDLAVDTLIYNEEQNCYDITFSSSSKIDPNAFTSLDATFVIDGTNVKNIYGEKDATEYTTALYVISAENDGIEDFWAEYGIQSRVPLVISVKLHP